MTRPIYDFAERGEVVVFAGAGVSAGAPSSLPGWSEWNHAIARALRVRLESALDRPNWLQEAVARVDAARNADQFPPEYQAQVIAEMCGIRYFEGLKALDVDVTNAGHDGIAAMAEGGSLKAIITTNFDRLIEKALQNRGVEFQVARDDAEFRAIGERLRSEGSGPLPVIKIHGCVSRPESIIDTLKQRRRKRSDALEECLKPLHPQFWLYLGFSAADLEDNPNYLGLVAGAACSAGATYLKHPRHSAQLQGGAEVLMKAFGKRGNVEVIDLEEFFQDLWKIEPGQAQFQQKLEHWASKLAPQAAGLCLAAMLEAVGEAEYAVRILDRLVRKEFQNERDTTDFRVLQLHYGRLGGAWGRFVNVLDGDGELCNASAETAQSLPRLLSTEVGFAVVGPLACALLWSNQGELATGQAFTILNGFKTGNWNGPAPRDDEEALDAWVCAAMICAVNVGNETSQWVVDTVPEALKLATECGDVVRAARVAALHLLTLAPTQEDVPAKAEAYEKVFEAAARVGDGFASGMRALALGRWFVGVGGLALARTGDPKTVAQQALDNLNHAIDFFESQGMDPWILFAQVQQAKAHADREQWGDANQLLEAIDEGTKRFPILDSHFLEALGQIQTLTGDERAEENLEYAVQSAYNSGLFARRDFLRCFIQPPE